MPNSIVESIARSESSCQRETWNRPQPAASGSIGLLPTTSVVIELTVRNHAGAMSHITGLFARRAFNLEAIACAPVGDGSTSRMFLLVGNGPRLGQVERQLAKLYDVLGVRHRDDIDAMFFARMAAV